MKISKIQTAAACAALAAALMATAADAKPRKALRLLRGEVIVVHPRAFTDSGNVVPVGSRSFYAAAGTFTTSSPTKYSPGLLWRTGELVPLYRRPGF